MADFACDYHHPKPKKCHCGSGLNSWWLYDCYGIPLDRVCSECEEKTRARYIPETFTGYRHLVEEAIEPDEY